MAECVHGREVRPTDDPHECIYCAIKRLRAERDALRETLQFASDILHGKHHDDQGRAYDAALEVIDAALWKDRS